MKFIHLTDTHFVPPGERLYGLDPAVSLRAAVSDINAHHDDAEMVVITGDLTHWGEPEAFAHLADVLSGLTMPIQLLIGNHDARDTFRSHFPEQSADVNGYIQSVHDTTMGRFVFLDTVLAGTHAGHYTPDRCAWLADTLETADRDVFFFMHHPPFPVHLPALDDIGLQQATDFRDVVEPHRLKIRHLFFGHVHRPMAGSWIGIPVSTVRAMNHQTWFDMKAVSLQGSHEPPAYAIVKIDADAVVIHYHDFMYDGPKYAYRDSPWDDWSRRNPHP